MAVVTAGLRRAGRGDRGAARRQPARTRSSAWWRAARPTSASGSPIPARYGVLFSERAHWPPKDYCEPVPLGPDGRPVLEFGAEAFALLVDGDRGLRPGRERRRAPTWWPTPPRCGWPCTAPSPCARRCRASRGRGAGGVRPRAGALAGARPGRPRARLAGRGRPGHRFPPGRRPAARHRRAAQPRRRPRRWRGARRARCPRWPRGHCRARYPRAAARSRSPRGTCAPAACRPRRASAAPARSRRRIRPAARGTRAGTPAPPAPPRAPAGSPR